MPRLVFRTCTSFAVAILAAIAFVRLAGQPAPSPLTLVLGEGLCLVLIVAATWRGAIYLGGLLRGVARS